ncbi:MAG: glycosyltransferase [Candidatus Brocadiae bacterium]|nr:glycosyltransferase [Candidatus Brocadiia bacterium]
MRVLQLTTDLRLGGAERVIINLVDCLRGEGVECAVAGIFERSRTPGKARERLEAMGVPTFCAGVDRIYQGWRFPRLRRFVGAMKPDLIHAHLFHGHLASVLVGRRGPVVWTHHATAPRWWLLRRAFYKLFAGRTDAHVFVSEAVRDYQHRTARVAPNEHVIHNGVDLGPFLAVRPEPGPVFGAVGRLVPLHKGFDLLIQAFARLCREKDEVTLKIAGDGPERGALEELARVEGVADRVEFVGFVDDVAGFLSGINVFVNPSRWEAFGNTLVEAMAAGLPCIAAQVGGLPEVGGDLVRWVRPDDVDDLYAAMREMAGVRYSREQVARQRARVATRFSREAMTREYLRLYRSLLR